MKLKVTILILFALVVWHKVYSQNAPDRHNTWAVIVGVSKYQNIAPLQYADKDALAVYDYLKSQVGVDTTHMQLLINEKATSAKIYGALGWLSRSVGEHDRVIFYFSGHGDEENETMYNTGFLLAYDSPQVAYMACGTVQIDNLQKYLDTYVRKKAQDVLLIVDACRSGKLAGGSQGLEAVMNGLGEKWNDQIIKFLSTQPGEVSLEDKRWGNGRGVFSYYLLKGLQGMADQNDDNVITTEELATYVRKKVAKATDAKQNPKISGNDLETLFPYTKQQLQLAMKPDESSGENTILASRGKRDELGPAVKTLYGTFRSYLEQGYLLHGASRNDTINCAKPVYLKLMADPHARSLRPSLQSSFVAYLQVRTDVMLDQYIKTGGLTAYNYEDDYREMLYAQSLTDHTDILYNYVKARLLFIESGRTNDAVKAIGLLKNIIRMEPGAAYAYNEIGRRFTNALNQPDSAVVYYKRAAELSPKWSHVCHAVASYFFGKRDYANALRFELMYQNSIKPENRRFTIETMPYHSGDKRMDTIYYRNHFAPDTFPHAHLALAYFKTGQPKKADSIIRVVDQEAALNLTSYDNNPQTLYLNIARVYINLKDYDPALKYLGKAIAADRDEPVYASSKNIQPYIMMANVYLMRKDMVGAMKALGVATKIAQWFQDGFLRIQRPVYFYPNFAGEPYSVLQALAKTADTVVKNDPASFGIYAEIGRSYSRLGNFSKAVSNYQTAASLGARQLAVTKDTAYRSMLKINVSDYCDSLGRAYQQNHDPASALKAYGQAIELAPERGDNYYALALFYFSVNDNTNGLKQLQIAFEKGFNNDLRMITEPGLSKVSDFPEFKALIKKYLPSYLGQ